MGGKLQIETAKIASGVALSQEIDLRECRIVAIQMPADWDTAAITFSSRPDPDGISQSVTDSGGTEVSVTAAADQYLVMVDADRVAVEGLAFTKVRSGTLSSPVNQTADRDVVLVVEPRY